MTNSGDSGGLKGSILKTIQRIKGSSHRKKLIIVSVVFMLFITVGLVYSSESGEKNYNKFASIVGIQNISLENHTSDNAILMDKKREISELSDIKHDVYEILEIKIPAYTINVNGKDLVALDTRYKSEQLLHDISAPFVDDEGRETADIEFKEDIKIIKELVGISEINDNYEEMLYYVTKGTSETKLHKVEKGENYWVIAKKYNIEVDNLIKANPDINPEKIQIGQEVSLVVPKPMITVITKEIREYKEYIAYETQYEETNVLYKGEYRVKKSGKNGEREIKAEVVKENGIEKDRNILEENITQEAITKVVLKGTKNPPPRIGTGKLAKPTSRGVLTSPFGWRWGRRHTGIDIGIPTGTPVKAADGGKVVYTGYKGGYGKCIILDHGENKQTLYAHNSKLLVKKGDKIFKGQTIANSGNTGTSTGPHLHFEVRINGIPVNPAKYVRY